MVSFLCFSWKEMLCMVWVIVLLLIKLMYKLCMLSSGVLFIMGIEDVM